MWRCQIKTYTDQCEESPDLKSYFLHIGLGADYFVVAERLYVLEVRFNAIYDALNHLLATYVLDISSGERLILFREFECLCIGELSGGKFFC